MEENDRKVIVVLGMHRSGTSVIARGLQVMGVDLGNNLMPPYQGNNSKGFWEDVEINALNIEMLHSLKIDWHFVTPIQPSDVDTLCTNGYLQRAVELLQKKTDNVKVFGFKDPRVTKLLPFWKEVFRHGQMNVDYVLVIRHPLSVCESLAKRDRFDTEKSYLLWLEYLLGGLVGTQEKTRVLVDYDYFMQTPGTEVTRIANELGLIVDHTELKHFEREFIDHNLRHTVHQLDDLKQEAASHPLVWEVYSSLLELATGSTSLEDSAFQTKIALWNREFSRMRSTLVFIDKLGSRISSVASVRDTLNAQRSTLLQEREQMAQNLGAKEQELQKVRAELQSVTRSRWWRWTEPLRRLFRRFQQSK